MDHKHKMLKIALYAAGHSRLEMFTNSLVAHSNTSRDTGREKQEKKKPWSDWIEIAIRYIIYWEKGCLVREKEGERKSFFAAGHSRLEMFTNSLVAHSNTSLSCEKILLSQVR